MLTLLLKHYLSWAMVSYQRKNRKQRHEHIHKNQQRTRIHTLNTLQNDTEMQYHYHYTKITQWNDTISETNSITLIDAIFVGMENIWQWLTDS